MVFVGVLKSHKIQSDTYLGFCENLRNFVSKVTTVQARRMLTGVVSKNHLLKQVACCGSEKIFFNRVVF